MTTTDRAARSRPITPARQLQTVFAAVRVSFTWLGVRKTLTPDQKAQAAVPFGAEGQYLSAAKKLLDTRDPRFRNVTGVRSRIVSYWKGMTLPYPDPGLRLIRQDQIQVFDSAIKDMVEELDQAVAKLDDNYETLRAGAHERLGSLFNAGDYPPSLRGLFECSWEFPSVEAPDYLRRLNPELYEQEKQRMTARFEEAARMAEEAFTAEFAKLVGHLVERISAGGPDGEPKVFRDSAVDGLKEFFNRFKALSINSNAQLDELVETAQKAVGGVSPQDLRTSEALRKQMSGQMAGVLSSLDGLLVDAPAAAKAPADIAADGGGLMELFIGVGGDIKALYGEEIPLERLGAISITRASFVEPNANGQWLVDLAPVSGPLIGPFRTRSQGLHAERAWLLAHHLPQSK